MRDDAHGQRRRLRRRGKPVRAGEHERYDEACAPPPPPPPPPPAPGDSQPADDADGSRGRRKHPREHLPHLVAF